MNFFYFEEEKENKKTYLNLVNISKVEVVEKNPKMTINQVRITWSDGNVEFIDLTDEQVKELLSKI